MAETDGDGSLPPAFEGLIESALSVFNVTMPAEQELAVSRDGYRYGVRQVDRREQPNYYILTGAASEIGTVDPDERFESYHMAVTALAEAITNDERQDDL